MTTQKIMGLLLTGAENFEVTRWDLVDYQEGYDDNLEEVYDYVERHTDYIADRLHYGDYTVLGGLLKY